jgi:hypothetical protein
LKTAKRLKLLKTSVLERVVLDTIVMAKSIAYPTD